MSKKKEDKVYRTRNFATIVYEDSAPKDWINILKEQFIPCFISPYHDKDINPTGEPKKPHWHVLIMYDSVKTLEQAKDVVSLINGVGIEYVQSLRGYARYLCHLDNPEKHLYNTADVQCLSGADYVSTIDLSIDKYKAIAEMIQYIKENNIYYYSDLLEYACYSRYDWFRVLCDCGSYVVSHYIKENYFKLSQKGLL